MKILRIRNKKYCIYIVLLVGSFVLNAKAQGTKQHPYLFFTEKHIQNLQNRIKSDTLMARVWTDMKSNAEKSVESKKGGDIREIALAYRMTGDKKFADRAKEMLLPVLQKEAWDGLDDRTPRWNSALGTAHTLEVVSNVYDAIYDNLSAKDRKYMAGRIVKLGIEPSFGDWIWEPSRIHSLNAMGHNWWSSIVFEAATASLAVMDEIPEAKDWVKKAMNASNEWFYFSGSVLENKPKSFDDNGGFYESINYANFGVSEYLFFRVAYTNAFGAIKMPYDSLLEKTMDWFIQNSYPNKSQLMSVNFGDSSPHVNADRPVKLMIELGFDKPSYRWYLDQIGTKHPFKEDLNINTAMGLVYEPSKKAVAKNPGLPTGAIYSDMGWATMRSSWDKDATMLAVKSGFTWNHAHADAGSFILYHNGENLLIDGGNVGYGAPEYSDYSVTSQAHNVILFNGEAQNPQDQYHAVKTSGHLYHLINSDNFKYLLADATGPTSEYFLRNYRNFLWIGNVILVVDDVKAYDYGKFEWLLHYTDQAKKRGIDLDITKGNASVIVRPLFPETLANGYPHDFPEKMILEERMGVKDHEPNVKVPYYAISPPEKYQQTKFINAIILLDDKNKVNNGSALSSMASAKDGRSNLPVIEKLEGNDYIGVKITQDGKTTEVYFNLKADGRLMHRDSHNEMNGWQTDAYMMALTYPAKAEKPTPDNLTGYFVSNGSYLRNNSKSIFGSLSKVFMYASVENGNANIRLQGQPYINATFNIKKPKQFVLNGKVEQPIYNKAGLEITIK
ncbi:MAG TPA: heparinase II/III family protein [Pelobium sp.]|nr:heparinase II/III family protein [Pelobium sp.]